MMLLNPAMLFGLALVAAPVLIHMLLRSPPKRMTFPAMRLLRRASIPLSRRMQIRRWLLLLLRMLALALLTIGLARPTLPAARYSPSWAEGFQLAAIGAIALALDLLLRSRSAPKSAAAPMLGGARSAAPRFTEVAFRVGKRIPGLAWIAAALVALVFVGWPYQQRLAAELSQAKPPVAASDVPVAAVFVFDVSQSMEYLRNGRSRLSDAQKIAEAHLERLPAGSKVAVVESGTNLPPVFVSDLAAARSRIDGLATKSITESLESRLRAAMSVLEDDRRRTLSGQTNVAEANRQDRFVREIYVFTDLGATAWRRSDVLAGDLKAADYAGLYLVDVGVDGPTNAGIVRTKLSRENVPAGSPVAFDVDLRIDGSRDAPPLVELFLAGTDGAFVKAGTQTASAPVDGQSTVRFLIENVEGRLRQGEVRLAGSDPLKIDDVAYFSFDTLPATEVLVVGERPADATLWSKLLAPDELIQLGRARYRTTVVRPSEWMRVDTGRHRIVCWIDVANPTADMWNKLADFQANGGGVFITLGAVSQSATSGGAVLNPVAYNSPEAMNVLPAKLAASLKFNPAVALDTAPNGHPLSVRLQEFGVAGELGLVAFHRYWSVEPAAASATILKFADRNQTPFLVEQTRQRGRAVLLAGSVVNPEWSDLPSSWSLLVLADLSMQRLLDASAVPMNYLAGDEATAPLSPTATASKYLLRRPGFKQSSVPAPQRGEPLRTLETYDAGNYQWNDGDEPARTTAVFSVNLSGKESDLRRLDANDLNVMLGEGRYAVCRDPVELERTIRAGRLGQELFGMVLACLIVAFVGETWLSNWFYNE